MLGRLLPSIVPAVFNRPRIRSNVVTMMQGIRANKTNVQIQLDIRARQGQGLNNQQLGQAVNYLKGTIENQRNLRFLPLQATPRIDTIPVFWGRMDNNFKSVVEMDVRNNKTGIVTRKDITVWYDVNMPAAQIRELGNSEMQRFLEEEPENDLYDVTILNTQQVEIWRRPILN